MTFEQWQATRVEMDDLRKITQDDYVYAGYVYDEHRFIIKGEKDGKPYFHTIIENTSPGSFDLEDVERDLYEWCDSAGDFDYQRQRAAKNAKSNAEDEKA